MLTPSGMPLLIYWGLDQGEYQSWGGGHADGKLGTDLDSFSEAEFDGYAYLST